MNEDLYPTECPACQGLGVQGRRITVYEHGLCRTGEDARRCVATALLVASIGDMVRREMLRPPAMTKLKIRKRERRGYVKEAGRHSAWTEFQVVDGRRVIGRFDFERQAEELVRELTAPMRDAVEST